MERAELVADDERAGGLEVQRAVARRVAGRMDDSRPAGDVERLAVRVRRKLADRPRLHRARAREVDEEAPRVSKAEVRQERRLVLPRRLARRGEALVFGVDVDRHARLLAE